MHNQYIKDTSGNIYIGLNNHDRKYCWYISALQRLHSSKSLNEQFTSKPKNIYLEPLYYYSLLNNITDLNQNNLKKYHNLIYESLERCISTFSNVIDNGGIPDHMLIGFMLPIIYIEYHNINLIENIVKELNINPTRFNNLLYSNQCKYMFRATKNNKLNNDIEQAYILISNELGGKVINTNNNFLISTMHVYFNNFNDSNGGIYPGHAINLVYGYTDVNQNHPKLYIIDDSTTIMPLDLYLNYHTKEIGYCDVMDISDNVINELKNNDIKINMRMHRCVLDLSERENTDIKSMINVPPTIMGGNKEIKENNEESVNKNVNNYENNNEKINKTNTNTNDDIIFEHQEIIPKNNDKHVNNYEKIYNSFNYNFLNYKFIIILVVVLVVIIIIFVFIKSRNKSEIYDTETYKSETYKSLMPKKRKINIKNPSYNDIKAQVAFSSNYEIDPNTLNENESEENIKNKN